MTGKWIDRNDIYFLGGMYRRSDMHWHALTFVLRWATKIMNIHKQSVNHVPCTSWSPLKYQSREGGSCSITEHLQKRGIWDGFLTPWENCSRAKGLYMTIDNWHLLKTNQVLHCRPAVPKFTTHQVIQVPTHRSRIEWVENKLLVWTRRSSFTIPPPLLWGWVTVKKTPCNAGKKTILSHGAKLKYSIQMFS